MSYTVQAQAYWSQQALLLEASIQTYFSTARQALDHVYLSHSVTASWLFNVLSLKTRPVVKASSFDYFKGGVAFWARNEPRQLEFKLARLSLNHPRPDPLPILQVLQKHKDPDWHRWLELQFNPAGRNSSVMGWILFVQTAQLLEERGRLDDAKWVLDLGRDMLPSRVQMMKPSEDGSDAANKRLPTSEEAAAGLVDSEGYFLSMKRRTLAYANGAAARTWHPERRRSDSPFPNQ